MQEFKLPDLGEGMHEAEIRRWLVKPGDLVKRDQPMVEVETDKAVVEIPSPIAGRVADIRVPEATMAKQGQVLVTFDSSIGAGVSKTSNRVQAASETPAMETLRAQSVVATATQVVDPPATISNTTSTARHRAQAAPAVRKHAFELGIDLEQVPSSQPSGRITMEDVQNYASRMKVATLTTVAPATTVVHTPQPPTTAQTNGASATTGTASTATLPTSMPPTTTPATDERQALTGLRRRIAERMEHAWRTIPHAVTFDEVDATELVALRQALKPTAEQRGVRLTYIPLLVKLLIPVLKEISIFNAHFDEERREIVYKRSCHVGIATDTPEGVLVPVLRNADQLTLVQIAQQLEHLVEGAKSRTLTLPELSGSSFTLNNIGSFGGGSGMPIINAPEVAILAVGRLQEKAIVRNGSVIVRTMMPLTLLFDHRVIDGAATGKFLGRFKELVEQPQRLMLDMI